MHELETDRLLLRHWRPEDRAPFAVLNAAVVANERSRAVMRRIGMHHDPDGASTTRRSGRRICAATCSTA